MSPSPDPYGWLAAVIPVLLLAAWVDSDLRPTTKRAAYEVRGIVVLAAVGETVALSGLVLPMPWWAVLIPWVSGLFLVASLFTWLWVKYAPPEQHARMQHRWRLRAQQLIDQERALMDELNARSQEQQPPGGRPTAHADADDGHRPDSNRPN
jgi:hypothetical protein